MRKRGGVRHLTRYIAKAVRTLQAAGKFDGKRKALPVATALACHLGVPAPTTKETGWLILRDHFGAEGGFEYRRELAERRALRVAFYDSPEWLRLRYSTLLRYGRSCMLCFASGGEMHVDHIKPRSKFPALALDPENLQVLCKACNLGKSNLDDTDFRP